MFLENLCLGVLGMEVELIQQVRVLAHTRGAQLNGLASTGNCVVGEGQVL